MVMSLFWHKLIEVRRQQIICASPTRTNTHTQTAVEAKHNLLLTEACHSSSIFCLFHAAVACDVICKPISTCNQEIEGMIKAFIPKSPVTSPSQNRSAASLETDKPLFLAPNPDKIQSPGPAARLRFGCQVLQPDLSETYISASCSNTGEGNSLTFTSAGFHSTAAPSAASP